MTEVNEVDIVFKKNKIIPDVLTKAPEQFLKVAYPGNLQVDKGNELTPTQVKNAPTAEWNVEDAVLYTLLMIDPDAPSRKNPTFREYQHWLVVNIPGSAIDKGDVLTAYVGSGPPKGTGLHRYIFLLYKQMGKLKFSEKHIPKNSGNDRGKFCTQTFVKKYKLGEALAGDFFQAKWDEYVPTVHKQLSGN
ncbi:protein D3-like [Stomoxys calcitrans]|uniref:protein D3-like n=1 Tax=Stomoxys calcitrans TaxID=35570 RepID=UPI0027E24A10|nr:protein D3-like [Stomoxys calcitrans]